MDAIAIKIKTNKRFGEKLLNLLYITIKLIFKFINMFKNKFKTLSHLTMTRINRNS